jgi:hypothetical protein
MLKTFSCAKTYASKMLSIKIVFFQHGCTLIVQMQAGKELTALDRAVGKGNETD